MITKNDFDINMFGEKTDLFTLTNGAGIKVRIMNHGGTILSLEVPDRNGDFADIVLGHDTAAEYSDESPYFGCVVGRYANRIQGGKFSLDGVEYKLAQNNAVNALHGGGRGFDKKIWATVILEDQNAIQMKLVSPDGDEGYPGEVSLTMTYTLTEANELIIDYEAETTKATPINLTNHTYFNLSGQSAGYIGDQVMQINASTFLPSNETSIPYGELRSVEGTVFDFREPVALGERIDSDDEQLILARGYDHNYCLNKEIEGELSFAARATDDKSGRVLDVFTTEPGVQLYTANWIDGVNGKDGYVYVNRGAFCLETQHYPNSPNEPSFPNTILRPKEKFKSKTIYQFSVN